MKEDFSLAYQRAEKMINQLVAAIPNLMVAIVVFFIFWFLAKLVNKGVEKLARRAGQPENVAQVLGRIASWIMVFLGSMIAITIVFPTLDASSVLSALGFTGVAVGFAFKDIFQNLLAGLLILITRPFQIGDQIVSGSHEGTVEDIKVRATHIRTYDNRAIIIPNSDLYTNRITVNTANELRRTSVVVGIGYGDDIKKAKTLLLEALYNDPHIIQDPKPHILARELGDFSINLEVRVWSDPSRQKEILQTQDQVIEIIHRVLPEAGIDMPFPTQQILFHDQTEVTDGDRTQQREGWPARQANPASRQSVQREDSQAQAKKAAA